MNNILKAEWGIILLIFSYVLVRSFNIALVNDECSLLWDLYAYKEVSFSDIFLFNGSFCTANTHLINSLINHLGTILFDEKSILYTRLFNTLLVLPYCLACSKIAGLITSNQHTRLVFFIFLTSFLYILDFLSLGRGYGLSVVCEFWALFCIIRFYQYHKDVDFYTALILCVLCCISNFSFIYFTIAGICCLYLILFARQKERSPKLYLTHYLLPLLVIFILLILYIYPVSQKLISCDPKYYGTSNGFVSGTIRSLIGPLSYDITLPEYVGLLKKMFMLVLLSYTGIYMIRIKKNYREYIPLIILFISAGLIYIQFYLNQVKFPVERTAMYIIPLLQILVLFSLNWLAEKKQTIICSIILAYSTVNWVFSANFSHTYSYYSNASNNILFDRLYQEIISPGNNSKDTIRIADGIPPVISTLIGHSSVNQIKNIKTFPAYLDHPGQLNEPADYFVYSYYFESGINPFFLTSSKEIIYHNKKYKLMLIRNNSNNYGSNTP